jgi:hypothetical protein
MVEGKLFKLGFKILSKTFTKGLKPIFWFFQSLVKVENYLFDFETHCAKAYIYPTLFIPKGENHPTMVIMLSSSWLKGFWVFALANQ